MSQRRRVLISAYACEPNKGSEPEVGWQWALQMARFHDVTVLTRANNRTSIASALETLPADKEKPTFVYHDLGHAALAFKKWARATRLYYVLWQRSLSAIVGPLHQSRRFDVLHHVTFATFRYPTAIWAHGAPTVWGPIGGMETIPSDLLPWSQPGSLGHELLRNLNTRSSRSIRALKRRAEQSTIVLASTGAMQEALSRLGVRSQLMPTIGLNPADLPCSTRKWNTSKPLRLLYVGNIITLKGLDLALEALKLSGVQSTLTLIGSGGYSEALKGKAVALGFSQRVTFLGRIPREQVLRHYNDFDVFVFPSLHDTGGYAVIEAMCNELPVICLDCGGPAVAVSEQCGFRVRVRKRANIVSDLAAAFQFYDRDRAALEKHGRAARARVLANYDWGKKGQQMDAIYREAIEKADKPAGAIV